MRNTHGGTIMETITTIIQLTIATVIFFVWTIRFNWDTNYRGGQAKNMREEFRVYGLPEWSLPLVGSAKIALAVTLVAGIWIPLPVKTAAMFMAALMAGAVLMHLRIRSDNISKAMPAMGMLAMSLFVAAA
jgi:hypothetical protein|tara:strand:+ start:217 stop:609 length:393 start_codon:yes stop_codon:yes gene_type:complete